jgi:hypothetical protein
MRLQEIVQVNCVHLCDFLLWVLLTMHVGKQILWDDRRMDYKKDYTHTQIRLEMCVCVHTQMFVCKW